MTKSDVLMKNSDVKSDQDIKEKGTKCLLCDKTFSNQGNMNTHMVLKHSEHETKMLNCSLCDSKFVRIGTLIITKEDTEKLVKFSGVKIVLCLLHH